MEGNVASRGSLQGSVARTFFSFPNGQCRNLPGETSRFLPWTAPVFSIHTLRHLPDHHRLENSSLWPHDDHHILWYCGRFKRLITESSPFKDPTAR